MTNLLGFASKHFVSIFASSFPPSAFVGQLYFSFLLDWNKEKCQTFQVRAEEGPNLNKLPIFLQNHNISNINCHDTEWNVLSCALNLFDLIFLSCLGLFLFYLQLISFLNTDLIVFSAYKNTAVLRAYWISVGEEKSGKLQNKNTQNTQNYK